MKLRVILLFAVLSLLLVACNRENTSVELNPEGGVDITTELNEADVNTIISDILAQSENPLLRDPEVDLQNGQIVVNGEHDRRDGGGRVSGNIVLTGSVSEGAILIQVSSVNIEGFDMGDERLTTLNQQLANAFTQRANRDNRLVNVQSLSITEDELTVTINARREGN